MNIALILAAGCGKRMGLATPKQFLDVGGKPILAYTLEAFQKCEEIDTIYVVCPEDSRDMVWEIVRDSQISKLQKVLPGGNTRRESSYKGVAALERVCAPEDVVLIHDGVRPNVTTDTIRENIRLAQTYGACVTAVETSDTIIMSLDGTSLASIPPRRFLWNVQTPQSFRYGVIWKAHRYYEDALQRKTENLPEITDDTGLVLYMEEQIPVGQQVRICKGNAGNLKVTKPDDLRILLSILPQEEGGSQTGDLC